VLHFMNDGRVATLLKLLVAGALITTAQLFIDLHVHSNSELFQTRCTST
jgi:hypothetical protein